MPDRYRMRLHVTPPACSIQLPCQDAQAWKFGPCPPYCGAHCRFADPPPGDDRGKARLPGGFSGVGDRPHCWWGCYELHVCAGAVKSARPCAFHRAMAALLRDALHKSVLDSCVSRRARRMSALAFANRAPTRSIRERAIPGPRNLCSCRVFLSGAGRPGSCR